jgi:hypothetical protein
VGETAHGSFGDATGSHSAATTAMFRTDRAKVVQWRRRKMMRCDAMRCSLEVVVCEVEDARHGWCAIGDGTNDRRISNPHTLIFHSSGDTVAVCYVGDADVMFATVQVEAAH